MLSRIATRSSVALRSVTRTLTVAMTNSIQTRNIQSFSARPSASMLLSSASSSAPSTTTSSSSSSPAASTESVRMTSVVITTYGPDRNGIVHDLSSELSKFGANIEDSRMTILGTEFAVMLLVTVPQTLDVNSMTDNLRARFPEFNFASRVTSAQPGFTGPVRIFSIDIEGPDQPGVVKSLTGIFAKHGGSIRDLDSDTSTAPFAGYKIFSLKCILALPVNADYDAFESALHKFEEDYGFDVEVREPGDEEDMDMDEDEDFDEDFDEEEVEEPKKAARGPTQQPQVAARQQSTQARGPQAPAGRGPQAQEPKKGRK